MLAFDTLDELEEVVDLGELDELGVTVVSANKNGKIRYQNNVSIKHMYPGKLLHAAACTHQCP